MTEPKAPPPIALTPEQAHRFKLQVGLAIEDAGEAGREFADGFNEKLGDLLVDVARTAHAGIEEVFSELKKDDLNGACEEAHKTIDAIAAVLQGDEDEPE